MQKVEERMFEKRAKAAAQAMFVNWEVGLGIARLGVAAADAVGGTEQFKLAKRPVAFQVRDPRNGALLIFMSEDVARRQAEMWGGVGYQGLYVRDGMPAAVAPMNHARTSPGPGNCSTWKRFHNEASPRTCERCGLGPCPFFNNDGMADIR